MTLTGPTTSIEAGVPGDVIDLTVRESRMVADGVLSLVLEHPDGLPLPAWAPGAHVDFFLPSGLVRQYSLCGDPADSCRYRIAVLREAESRGGSREIHDTGLVGKRVSVRGPRNHFPLAAAERYLFLAGGIGITPILAMARAVSRAGVPWELIYGGRTRNHLAFLDEIDAFAGGTVTVLAEDVDGRPDLRAALDRCDDDTAVYCCGPGGMLDAVETAAAELLAPGQLHTERFTGSASPPEESGENTAFEVELAQTGITLTVPPDRSLLDVVLDVVPQHLFSCQEGYCGTCEVRVLSGEPDHRDSILTDEERKDRMMICVGRSRSPKLVLDL